MILNIDKEEMIKKIINSKKEFLNPFYWYACLDYSKETSHAEYGILTTKVNDDVKKIEEALYLINQYENIGITFTNK